MTADPVTYIVAERRDGKWLLGDDWSSEHDTLEEAQEYADRLREVGARYGRDPEDIGTFALVPVGGAS